MYEDILRLVEHRIDIYNRHYRCDLKDIKIKKMKTRWGSCSKKKNLNFNAWLIDLPDYLIDYVVVHELCHLIEFNHSRAFWSLVSQTMPDHRSLRVQLRKAGRAMHRRGSN